MAKTLSLSLRDELYVKLTTISKKYNCSVLDIIRFSIDLYIKTLDEVEKEDRA